MVVWQITKEKELLNIFADPNVSDSNPTDVLSRSLGPSLIVRFAVTFGSNKIKRSD